MKITLVIIAATIIVGLFYSSAGHQTEAAKVVNRFIMPDSEFRTGDVILRSGKGLVSDMFRKFNLSGAPWSHAGILVRKNDQWLVYHIIGNAGDPNHRIKSETISSFCHSAYNTGFALYRNSQTVPDTTLILHYLDSLRNSGVTFDHQFNLNDDQKLYCTELVYKTLRRAGFDSIPVSVLNGQHYVAADDLYRHASSRKVTEIHY